MRGANGAATDGGCRFHFVVSASTFDYFIREDWELGLMDGGRLAGTRTMYSYSPRCDSEYAASAVR